MIESILLRATDDATGAAAYATARGLARRFGARVTLYRPRSIDVR